MRKNQKDRVKQLFNEGFSVPELAIMYEVSEHRVKRILEESDEF